MGEVAYDISITSSDLDLGVFTEGSIPEQKALDNGLLFPYVFFPSSLEHASLDSLTRGLSEHKMDLEVCITKHGGLLLRGFEVLTPSDFNEVLEATGYSDFPYVGRGAARTRIVGRVSTTNTSQPSHVGIGYHNEMAYQVKHPGKVIFYCIKEQPEGNPGGATPVVLGHVVYQRLSKDMPDFLHQVETKGLMYNYPLEDKTKSQVYSWQTMFRTDDMGQAEERAKDLGIKLEWNMNGGASALFGPRPGVKSHPLHNGRKVWFNALDSIYEFQLFLKSRKNKNEEDKMSTSVTYGDGSPIKEDDIQACRKILKEEEVAFKWCKGDILILDNMAVMHSRQPYHPSRRVLASMCF